MVYEDKKSLSDFEVNDKNSLNYLIYIDWLLTRVEIDPFDKNHRIYYLKAFNDAYYLCTLTLLLPDGKGILPDRLLKKVDRPSVVFPLVYLYLSNLTSKSIGISLFLRQLDTAFKNRPDWLNNFVELNKLVSKKDICIDPNIFSQRQLTSEVLSLVNWCELTGTFNKENIEVIVRNYARSKDVWYMMIETIKNSAQKYDYDFGFEDYTDEGYDEDGPYTRTIKVPKAPYDYDGNEILDPLKRAGVYQFCDELLTKYDELAVKAQPMNIVVEELMAGNAEKSCFRHINSFVREKVKNICEQYHEESHANLALIEKRLFEKGWLKKSNQHKLFVKELISWGILSSLTDNDIKRVTQGMADKMRDLRNSGYNENDNKICEGIDSIIGQ